MGPQSYNVQYDYKTYKDLCGLKDFHGGKFFDSHAWMSAFKDFHNFKDFCCVKIYDFTYKISFEKLCNFKKINGVLDFQRILWMWGKLKFLLSRCEFWNFSHIGEFSDSLEGWWFFMKVLKDKWFRIFIGGQFNFLMGCVLCGVFFVMICPWDF